MAGVVLDAVAVAHLLHHLEVVLGAHFEPLCLEIFPVRLEECHPLDHLVTDPPHGNLHLLLRGDELLRREERQVGEVAPGPAGEGIEDGHPVDLVAEELDPDRLLVVLGRKDLEHVAAHAEPAPGEFDLVPLVEHLDDPLQHLLPGDPIATLEGEDHLEEVLGGGESVDAGDA